MKEASAVRPPVPQASPAGLQAFPQCHPHDLGTGPVPSTEKANDGLHSHSISARKCRAPCMHDTRGQGPLPEKVTKHPAVGLVPADSQLLPDLPRASSRSVLPAALPSHLLPVQVKAAGAGGTFMEETGRGKRCRWSRKQHGGVGEGWGRAGGPAWRHQRCWGTGHPLPGSLPLRMLVPPTPAFPGSCDICALGTRGSSRPPARPDASAACFLAG